MSLTVCVQPPFGNNVPYAAGIDLSTKFANSCFYVAIAHGYLFFQPCPIPLATSVDLLCMVLHFSGDNTGHFIMKNCNLVLNSSLEESDHS